MSNHHENSSRYLTRKKSPGKTQGPVSIPRDCKPGENNFQPYSPHKGCHYILCVNCGVHKSLKACTLQPSVYSFKGRSFAFNRKDKFHPPRNYEC